MNNREGVISSGLSCQLIEQVQRTDATLLVFEKYYMRASNRASLSIMISSNISGRVQVDGVASGGGQGVFFRFSWGAEESFVSIIPKLLSPHGFQ